MSEEFKIPYQDLTDININNLIVERNTLIQENNQLKERLSKIKEYLKQVHIEQQNGILSSNNLIWDNIVRLCDGLEILGDKENE